MEHIDDTRTSLIRKGDLVCLEGPVGGGKSSVLSAILAELSLSDGQIFLSNINQGTRR